MYGMKSISLTRLSKAELCLARAPKLGITFQAIFVYLLICFSDKKQKSKSVFYVN